MRETDSWRNDPIVLVEKRLNPLAARLLRFAGQKTLPDDATMAAMKDAGSLLRRVQSDLLDPMAITMPDTAQTTFLAFADHLDELVDQVTSTHPDAPPKVSDIDFLAGPFVDAVEGTLDALRASFLEQVLMRQSQANRASAVAAREVTSISRQIYFISINASVEAARAGDAGRSFAVIGAQIRALSQEAASASKRISSQTS